MSDRQDARLALVTGACAGLGAACCRQLQAAGGWFVVGLDREETSGATGVDEFRLLDVTDHQEWMTLRDGLRDQFPRIDLLINCAGVCAAGEICDSDHDVFRRVMEINYFGTLNGCQTFGPGMREVGRGHIVNVASILGLISPPGMAAYASTKAAVASFTESLYAELRPHGVGVTLVAPGFFSSELIERGEFTDPTLRQIADEYVQKSEITADVVAAAALRGVERQKLYVIVGRRARRYWRLKRLAPSWLLRRIASQYHTKLDRLCDANRE